MPKTPNLEQNPKKPLEGDLLSRVLECIGWLFVPVEGTFPLEVLVPS